jgi:hypothetical protein
MPDLAEIIARYHAARPTPINSDAVLAPRGHAVLSIIHIAEQLSELEPGDRAFCLGMTERVIEETATLSA